MNAEEVQRRLGRIALMVAPLLNRDGDRPWTGLDYTCREWDEAAHAALPCTPHWHAFGISAQCGLMGGGDIADAPTIEAAINQLEMKLVRALKADTSGRACVREALEAAAREREAAPTVKKELEDAIEAERARR
jgi:hypothetical protein